MDSNGHKISKHFLCFWAHLKRLWQTKADSGEQSLWIPVIWGTGEFSQESKSGVLRGWGENESHLQAFESLHMVKGWGSVVLFLRTESDPLERCSRDTDFCSYRRNKTSFKKMLPIAVSYREWVLALPSFQAAGPGQTGSLCPDRHTLTLPALNLQLLEAADSVSTWPSALLQTSGVRLLECATLVLQASFLGKRFHDFFIPSWSLEFQNIFKTGYPCFIDVEISEGLGNQQN